MKLDAIRVDAVLEAGFRAASLEFAERAGEVLAERLQPARLTDGLHVGDADAVGRQHARERMDENPLHPQRVRDPARMLAAGAAKARQRVASHVMAARDGNLAD